MSLRELCLLSLVKNKDKINIFESSILCIPKLRNICLKYWYAVKCDDGFFVATDNRHYKIAEYFKDEMKKSLSRDHINSVMKIAIFRSAEKSRFSTVNRLLKDPHMNKLYERGDLELIGGFLSSMISSSLAKRPDDKKFKALTDGLRKLLKYHHFYLTRALSESIKNKVDMTIIDLIVEIYGVKIRWNAICTACERKNLDYLDRILSKCNDNDKHEFIKSLYSPNSYVTMKGLEFSYPILFKHFTGKIKTELCSKILNRLNQETNYIKLLHTSLPEDDRIRKYIGGIKICRVTDVLNDASSIYWDEGSKTNLVGYNLGLLWFASTITTDDGEMLDDISCQRETITLASKILLDNTVCTVDEAISNPELIGNDMLNYLLYGFYVNTINLGPDYARMFKDAGIPEIDEILSKM